MTPRTPRTSRLAGFVSAACLFAAFGASCSMHAQRPTPCELLTPAQITTVLDGRPDTSVLNGKPGAPADGTVDCTWADNKGETRVYLSLQEPGIHYNALRNSMQASGRLVPVPGLSSDAFYISSAGNDAALYVLKGKHLLLITVDGDGFTKVQNENAEHTLATEILPRL